MSKSVKKIASIALPVIGTIVAPGIGTAIGTSLGATGAAASALGGAALGGLGGAIGGGGLKGIAQGAALGGLGGYTAGGGLGTVAGSPLAGAVGPTQGTGALGAITRAVPGLAGSVTSTGLAGGNLGTLSTLGNLASGIYSSGAAGKAADQQVGAINRAITAQTRAQQEARQTLQPFVDSGTNSLQSYQSLVNDPNAQASFINNNPFYKSLADDAQKRLLANQAARGKIGSGGTAASLQNQLTLLGNQLLQGQIGNLQNQVTLGQNAASGVGSGILQTGNNVSNLLGQQGIAQSAGTVGQANAVTGATQSGLNTLLELQRLQNPYQQQTIQPGTRINA